MAWLTEEVYAKLDGIDPSGQLLHVGERGGNVRIGQAQEVRPFSRHQILRSIRLDAGYMEEESRDLVSYGFLLRDSRTVFGSIEELVIATFLKPR
jgi:hypothetical protein